MAVGKFDPTYANILSSLGIKGATTDGGEGQQGKVPVLGDDGKLGHSMFDLEDIAKSISIPGLERAAFIDPNADTAKYTPTGSAVSPFKTLDEAAKYSDGGKTFSNFILYPSSAVEYGQSTPVFATQDSIIRIVGLGHAQFQSLELHGHRDGTTIMLQNVGVAGAFSLFDRCECSVVLTGYGSFGSVVGASDNSDDPSVSNTYLKDLYLDSGVSVGRISYVGSVHYISWSSRVANSSVSVGGATVADAVDSIGTRRVRVPKFSTSEDGIAVSETEDVKAENKGDAYDVHDASAVGSTLVEAVNKTFYKEGDSPTFKNGLFASVKSSSVNAEDVSTSKLTLGGLPVYINADLFLVVGDGEPTVQFYVLGSDIYFKSYMDGYVQHYVKQVAEHDDEIGWGVNWTGDYILVDGKFVNTETGTSDYDGDGTAEEYYRIGSDLYFKSYSKGGVQHYVKQTMSHDEEIGWGADWTGDYILVDGEFVPSTT